MFHRIGPVQSVAPFSLAPASLLYNSHTFGMVCFERVVAKFPISHLAYAVDDAAASGCLVCPGTVLCLSPNLEGGLHKSCQNH